MVLSPVKLSDQEVHVQVCPNKNLFPFQNFTISFKQVPELYREINTCPEHNFDTMVPIALATWQTNYNGESLRVPGILAESQVVQESLDIPGSDIRLMYHSSRAKGYFSTIQLQRNSCRRIAEQKQRHNNTCVALGWWTARARCGARARTLLPRLVRSRPAASSCHDG